MQVFLEPQELGPPEDGCELPNLNAGNSIWFLWEKFVCINLRTIFILECRALSSGASFLQYIFLTMHLLSINLRESVLSMCGSQGSNVGCRLSSKCFLQVSHLANPDLPISLRLLF